MRRKSKSRLWSYEGLTGAEFNIVQESKGLPRIPGDYTETIHNLISDRNTIELTN